MHTVATTKVRTRQGLRQNGTGTVCASDTDSINWAAYAPPGCDCLSWVALMTADEAGLRVPKPTLCQATGELLTTYPSVEPVD